MTETTADAPSGAQATKEAAAAGAYKWYVLAILTLVYMFNFVDRQIIAIVSPSIKEDLGLDDETLGLLKGFAFVVLYTTLGLPIAWAADRWNRVGIVTIALTVWSGFTALSAFAQSALHLALARIGVGVGEAGGSPPSHSLISDYFPKEKRATALAIFSLGIPFGQMLAFLAGGWVVAEFGWRMAFLLVGLPGVLLAVILKLTVKEPARGAQDRGAVGARPPFRESLKALMRIPTFWGVTAATALASFTGYGVGMWAVDFYKRVHGLSIIEITVPLGLLNGIAYAAGTYAGGYLTDRFGRTDKRAYAFIPGAAMLATIPCGLLSLWATTPFWAFFWIAPFLIFLGMYLGPSFSLIQTLTPVNFRAFAIALSFFILNMFALGGAPWWVGRVSKELTGAYGEGVALQIALSTLIVTSFLAALAFFWTARKIPADWERATSAST